MSLTDQQFRKLLTKGIEERKAYERTSMNVRLLKEGVADFIKNPRLHSSVPASELYSVISAIGNDAYLAQYYSETHEGAAMFDTIVANLEDVVDENSKLRLGDAMRVEDFVKYKIDNDIDDTLFQEQTISSSIREEETPPSSFEEVYDAVWAFIGRKGFTADLNKKMRKIVTDHGWEWDDYAQRSVEELEAHEQHIATILGINENKTLTEVQDPKQAAIDELMIMLNQTSYGDYRSQIENIIRILNPDVGGYEYQLQPVEFRERKQ